MRICFVSFQYPPFTGGASVYADNITRELSKSGHEIYVIAPSAKEKRNYIEEDINLVRVPMVNIAGLRYLSYQLRLRRIVFDIMKKVNIDVLHINGINGVAIGKSSVPQVVTYHHVAKDIQNRLSVGSRIGNITGEGNPLILFAERRQLMAADRIIAVSHATKRFLVKYYAIREADIHVIHNGVYHNCYNFSRKEIKETKSGLGIDVSTKLIYCPAARINEPRKGVKYLIHALPTVLSKANAICIVSGSGTKESFGRYLKRLPEESVRFAGFLNEDTQRRILGASDVFVLPSLLEGCPLSVLEGMAAGVPIVSTKVGGIPELVKDGRNGLLVEPANPAQLAEAIISILCDEDVSNRISMNNYNDARELFSWKRAASMTERVYKYAIGEIT